MLACSSPDNDVREINTADVREGSPSITSGVAAVATWPAAVLSDRRGGVLGVARARPGILHLEIVKQQVGPASTSFDRFAGWGVDLLVGGGALFGVGFETGPHLSQGL